MNRGELLKQTNKQEHKIVQINANQRDWSKLSIKTHFHHNVK